MDYFKFEIKNQEDRDFINVVLLSLMQMEDFCKKRKTIELKELNYNKEDKNIELFDLFVFTSKEWVFEKTNEVKKLLENEQKEINLKKEDFLIIKYLVEMYWDNMKDVLGVSPLLSIEDTFNNIAKRTDMKKTFKIVK